MSDKETIIDLFNNPDISNQTDRQKWIWKNRIPQLLNGLKSNENITIDAEQAFNIIRLADPSINKSAMQWIVECYLREGFLWEDCLGGKNSKVSETLSLFARFKNNLTVEQKNVYGYKTLSDLYKSIEIYAQQFNQKDSSAQGRALKRLEKQQALSNTHILLDQPDLKVVIPLTQTASEWWGRGTRWCTAAENNNQFDRYNKQAPLIVTIFNQDILPVENKQVDNLSDKSHDKASNINVSKQRKLQLWVNKNQFQFMDETDSTVSVDLVHENWEQLKPVILWALNINPAMFIYLPDPLKTQQMCLNVISKVSSALNTFDHIPKNLRTEAVCLAAIKQLVYNFSKMEKEEKTYKVCSTALAHTISCFNLIPLDILDEKMCMKAIKCDPDLIEYVPKKLQNYNMALEVINQNAKLIKFIRADILTLEMYRLAIRNQPQTLSFITELKDFPQQILDQHLYLTVVEKDGSCLKYVPEKFCTKELYLKAFQQDPTVLNLVPKQYLTKEMYKTAVQADGEFLSKVPYKMRDKEICLKAVKSSRYALGSVPNRLLDQEICDQAIQSDHKDFDYIFSFIPDQFKTYNLCTMAITNDVCSICHIPKKLIDAKICELAVEKNSKAIVYIPESFITISLCKQAFYNTPSLIRTMYDKLKIKFSTDQIDQLILDLIEEDFTIIGSLPNELVTDEFYFKAIKVNLHCVKASFKKIKNKEIFDYVFEQDPLLFAYIPEQFQTQQMWLKYLRDHQESYSYVPEKFKTKDFFYKLFSQKSDDLSTQEPSDFLFDQISKYRLDSDLLSKLDDKTIQRIRSIQSVQSIKSNITEWNLEQTIRSFQNQMLDQDKNLINSI